ncbi:MAG: YjfB family protein [Lachnospiraceae bacterium]|nr:YjfB family protein [Lachnospiraceae bacterium]
MDIAGMSMALSQVNLQTDIGVALLSKSMDMNETLGAGMVNMIEASAMEQSVTPHIGGNIDLYV